MAIVIIAMLGNPFSPGYARARAQAPDGRAPALRHASMHVALYGRRGHRWSLEEGALPSSAREPWGMVMGSSWIGWVGDRLVIDLDERSVPFNLVPFPRSALHRWPPGAPIRGRVTIHPEAMAGHRLAIDRRGDHLWWPVAPLARIEVDLTSPRLRFSGHGYHDANAGAVALETTFDRWSWSRCRADGRAWLTYDIEDRDGARRCHALAIDPDGSIEESSSSVSVDLGRSRWGVRRDARLVSAGTARLERVLEDGPFYARSVLEQRWGGHRALAMHETLAAHRLRRRWVQFCAGYRIRVRRR